MKSLRLYYLLIFVTALTVFSSCQTKKGTIEDLRELRTEVRVNGENYDNDDWDEFDAKHAKIIEELEKYELTEKEEELVDKLNAEITGYKMKYDLRNVVGGLVNSVAQVIDDATGLNTSSLAKSLTESKSVQRQIEKKTKNLFWIRAAWIGGSILLSGLVALVVALLNTGRTRGARRSRARRH